MIAFLLIMTTKLKSLVSKNKKRYQEGGFNLDLSYIQDNIIAMGFPSEKFEAIYRNNIDDVVKFFEQNHKDHYKIYNLCNERHYDLSRFHNNVSLYPFDDHNPPKLEKIKPFCEDVDEWLSADEKNVVAIHCKAGKGRTGVMITAYLLHKKIFDSAIKALKYYGEKRTHDHKGVTIPSQRRYVEYYGDLVTKNFQYKTVIVLLQSLIMDPIPTPTGGLNLRIVAYQRKSSEVETECESPMKIYNSEIIELKKGGAPMVYFFNPPLKLGGDIKIELWNHLKLKKKEKLCSFWFNTFFVNSSTESAFTSSVSSVYSTSSTSSSASPEYRSNSDSSISRSSLDPNCNSSTPRISDKFICKNSRSSTAFNSPAGNGLGFMNNDESCNSRKDEKMTDRLSVFGNSTPSGSRFGKNGRSRFNSGPPPTETGNDRRCAIGKEIKPDYSLILTKEVLDKANKDKTHKIFNPDFKIQLNFMKLEPSQFSNTLNSSSRTSFNNIDGIKFTGKLLGSIGIPALGGFTNKPHEVDGSCSDSEIADTDTETEGTDEEWGGCSVDI